MITLPIKKKWYDKKEEYRAIKPYYTKSFSNLWRNFFLDGKTELTVVFRNGYRKNSPTITAVYTIDRDTGNSEWDAGPEVYRLHIM